jgi:hypothetical protein
VNIQGIFREHSGNIQETHGPEALVRAAAAQRQGLQEVDLCMQHPVVPVLEHQSNHKKQNKMNKKQTKSRKKSRKKAENKKKSVLYRCLSKNKQRKRKKKRSKSIFGCSIPSCPSGYKRVTLSGRLAVTVLQKCHTQWQTGSDSVTKVSHSVADWQ